MSPKKRKPQPRQTPSKGGRPSKCTPEVVTAICDHVRKGNFLETAAWSVGIDDRTLMRWKAWGAQHRQPYAAFCQAVKQAEADAEIDLVAQVKNPPDKAAAIGGAILLERRFRKRWSRGELEYELRERQAQAQIAETEARAELARAKSRGDVIDVNVLDAQAVKDIFERRHGFPAIASPTRSEPVGGDVPAVSTPVGGRDP